MVVGRASERDAAFLIQLCCAKEYVCFPFNCKADQAVITHEFLYHSL